MELIVLLRALDVVEMYEPAAVEFHRVTLLKFVQLVDVRRQGGWGSSLRHWVVVVLQGTWNIGEETRG